MPPKIKPADAVTQDANAPAITPAVTAGDAIEGEVAVELLTISVRCTRPQGIWRAGRFWPPEITKVPAIEFDQAQLDSILTEPLLAVTLTA